LKEGQNVFAEAETVESVYGRGEKGGFLPSSPRGKGKAIMCGAERGEKKKERSFSERRGGKLKTKGTQKGSTGTA